MSTIEVLYEPDVELRMRKWLEENIGGPVVHSRNVATGPNWRLYHTTKRDNYSTVFHITRAEFKCKDDATMFALRWT